MTFAFRAKNLGPLRDIDWRIPQGVSVVVGPNGVGKSTLLRLPELARQAASEGLDRAIVEIFDGPAFLRHHGASVEEGMSFAARAAEIEWSTAIRVAGGTVANFSQESISIGETTLFERPQGSPEVRLPDQNTIAWGVEELPRGLRHRFATWIEQFPALIETNIVNDEVFRRFKDLPKFKVFNARETSILVLFVWRLEQSLDYQTYRYHINHIAKFGSRQSAELKLLQSGENVFPLLRNWRDRSEHEHRYEFVLSTLREAFPHVKKLDFEQAGQTVTVAVVDNRYSGKKTPISRESTGFLTALLHLCAIASGEESSLVTLDELETSLHPRAIKVLISAFRSWAKEHDLSIVLATQSETVLDQFQEEPEKIQVLEPKMSPGPRALTDLYSPEWLKQFSLGDLFGQLEYGSGNTE